MTQPSADFAGRLAEYGIIGVVLLFLMLERWAFNNKVLAALQAIVVALARRDALDSAQRPVPPAQGEKK